MANQIQISKQTALSAITALRYYSSVRSAFADFYASKKAKKIFYKTKNYSKLEKETIVAYTELLTECGVGIEDHPSLIVPKIKNAMLTALEEIY